MRYNIGMTISTYLVLGVWIGLCVALPILLLAFAKNERAKATAMGILFVIYLAITLIGTWANIAFDSQNMTIYFDFGTKWGGKNIDYVFQNFALTDIYINLCMLVPLGLVVSYFFKHLKPLTAVILCWFLGFISGFFIELSQYILPISRVVQVSDAIFNMVGLFVGGLIGRICIGVSKKIYKQK